MNYVSKDYNNYLMSMKKKDYLLADPPWKLDDRPPRVVSQLKYQLWPNNITGMMELFALVKTNLMFVWAINAIQQEVHRAMIVHNMNSPSKIWIQPAKFTWRKLTSKGNEFFGNGSWNRNCSEDVLIFSRFGFKPARLQMRSLFSAINEGDTKKKTNLFHHPYS